MSAGIETQGAGGPPLAVPRAVPEHVVPDEAPATTTTIPSSPSSPPQTTTTNEVLARYAWQQGVIGSLRVAALILAARAILLFAVLGAIALAVIALSASDYVRLIALALYTVTVVCPLIWLSGRG